MMRKFQKIQQLQEATCFMFSLILGVLEYFLEKNQVRRSVFFWPNDDGAGRVFVTILRDASQV